MSFHMPARRLKNRISARQKHRRENMFSQFFNHMPISMIITDCAPNSNAIIFANESFRHLTGYCPREVIGQDCRFLQGPDTDREHSSRIRSAIESGSSINIDILNYRKDNSTFWNALYLSPIYDKRGRISLYCASQIDITARVEHNRQIHDYNATIRKEVEAKAQALEDLKIVEEALTAAVRQGSEFVANMSHELRTPLTGMIGLHDLLRADPTLDVKQRRYLTMACEAGNSLLTIVNDILDFSKIEAGELNIDRSPFELLTLIESCEDIIAEPASVKGVTIDILPCDPSLKLLGDAVRIKQILLNMMSNAIKFTEHGTVTISAGFSTADSRLRIEVSDTGIGISDDHLPLLFKRFSQADASITRRFGGTGLGLAICDRLVGLMDGSIGVASEFGRGSTFWFEIPIEAVDATIASLGDVPYQLSPPKRILLAEDNLVNQEIIKSMLEVRGHTITLVDNGAAAAATAAAAARSDNPFDLILMDLQMPIMDGLSATKIIRLSEANDDRPAIPIIALTANAMSDEVARCFAAGINRHVAKPIRWNDLFAAMSECGGACEPPTSQGKGRIG